MPHYSYERLSEQDNDFLRWERPGLPMHLAGLQIFRGGPLLNEFGGVDFDRISQMIEGILYRVPRYRQKLAWIPGKESAVWVDDPHFKLRYHLRHASLPRPGSERQLKNLLGHIMARALDRAKPLWELWVVEGLEEGRFATIQKMHHCMIDGVAGADLAYRLFSESPEYTIPDAPPFYPRPMPSDAELRKDDRMRQLRQFLRGVDGVRILLMNSAELGMDLAKRMQALRSLVEWKLKPASDTPLNGPVKPHRICDWAAISLIEAKTIRGELKCSINDVLLGMITGAIREYMIGHQVNIDELDFRVESPVNIRAAGDEGKFGNRVSSWIIRLPLAVEDPVGQVREIRRATQELKETHQTEVMTMLYGLMDWLSVDIQAAAKGTINMVATNVPGPQFPLYMLGAELLEIYPLAPLMENLGLSIGIFSYNGHIYFGLNADYDRVPDLPDFARMVDASFKRLIKAVAAEADKTRSRQQNKAKAKTVRKPARKTGKKKASKKANKRNPSRRIVTELEPAAASEPETLAV